MSIFSSQLLSPWWLLLGLLAVPILALYMLKLRRREATVSSTMLWQALLRDRQANTPWQRLKRNLLLLLQLLILTALTLALARPAVPIPSIASGSVVVLLDASASMATIETDGNDGEEITRLELARHIVQDMINGLPSQGRMTLIQVARQPVVLAAAEEDKTILQQALAQVIQTAQSADWEAVFALANGAVNAHGSGDTTIVILSDGGLPGANEVRLGFLEPTQEVRYVPVGNSSDNLAISAFASRSVRSGQSAGNTTQLFTRLTNYGDQDRQAVLSLYLFDGQATPGQMNPQATALLSARQVTIPAGAEVSVTLEHTPDRASSASPPNQPAVYKAQISMSSTPGLGQPGQGDRLDALPLDDAAFAVQQPGTSQGSQRALLVSLSQSGVDSQVYYLQQMLTAYERVTAYQIVVPAVPEGSIPGSADNVSAMSQLVESAEGFDLYVIAFNSDGDYGPGFRFPAQGSLLLINPPTSSLFLTKDAFTPQPPILVRQHPLTQFLEWQNIYIRQARQLQTPTWLEPLVESEQGPLVLAGETNGQRVAVITFDLDNSDFPLHIDFPILFANLMDYLIPAQAFSGTWMERGYYGASPSLNPGDSLDIHISPDIEQLAIASPLGNVFAVQPTSDVVQFIDTSELGLYAVSFFKTDSSDQGQQVADAVEYFSVNLFDEGESNIRPVKTIQIGQRTVAAVEEETIGQRELWPWLGGLALLVLLSEWWVYHARQGSTLRASSAPAPPNPFNFGVNVTTRFLPRRAPPHDRV